MAKRQIPEPDLGFPPGDFCVAFVNTGLPTASYLRRPRTRRPRKLIESFRDLVDWAVTAGGVSEDEARRLLAAADERPDEAAVVVSRALELRKLLVGLIQRFLTDRALSSADVEALNGFLSGRRLVLATATGQDGLAWKTVGTEGSLDLVPGLLAGSAARLLLSGDLLRLRQCAGRDCQQLFIDSRNVGRRWCDGLCRNRVQERRRAERHRRSSSREDGSVFRDFDEIKAEYARWRKNQPQEAGE